MFEKNNPTIRMFEKNNPTIKMFEKNNPTIALNILYIKEKAICPIYIS